MLSSHTGSVVYHSRVPSYSLIKSMYFLIDPQRRNSGNLLGIDGGRWVIV